jgi:hypothetical protein
MKRSQRLWLPEDAFFPKYVNMNEMESRYSIEDETPAIVDCSH